MNTQTIAAVAGVLSVVLALYASIPYILSTIRGKTKPHQLTWIVFAILGTILTISQFMEGARASIMISVAFVISDLIIIALAFKYGVRNTSRYDKLLFSLCLAAIAAWVITQNNVLAILLVVLIDTLAVAMMILKIKAHPDSEAVFPWVVASAAWAFGCLALANTKFGIVYVWPFYVLLSDLVIVASIYYFRSLKAH